MKKCFRSPKNGAENHKLLLDMDRTPFAKIELTKLKGVVIMSKKVVIISFTPVRGGKGNSEILGQDWLQKAYEMGKTV